MRREGEKKDETLGNLLMVGVAVVIILLIVLFKLKAGILGVIIGTVAALVLIYWLMEVKRIFQEKAPALEEPEWFYDLIEEEENITFVAKVPGPAQEVKVKIVRGMLEVRGGGNFLKRIQVPKGVELQDEKYANGILQVRLRKTETLQQQDA